MRVVRDMGIEDILKLHLTEPEVRHVLGLDISKVGISDLYRKFSHGLMKRLHPGDSLLFDVTSIPSYCSLDIFEYRHAK